MTENDIIIDIQTCLLSPALSDNTLVKIENSTSQSNSPKNVNEILSPAETNINIKNDKRKSLSAKKPPKPPRPPRGLSLDAADQKLIKELSELAMIKRARIERMKALKKMRAAKGSSSSGSHSSGNLIAMLFTFLFCIVIIFQGCHSSVFSRSNSVSIFSSPESKGVIRDGTIIMVVEDHQNRSTSLPIADVN